jgi:hypothetical protein|tara:strand:+ start:752 stop:928 length:177 start_codon:yes stop_codon:yes gene_type:complete
MNNQILYICLQQQKEKNMAIKLKKIKKELLGASKMHKRQANTIGKIIKKKKKNVKKRA